MTVKQQQESPNRVSIFIFFHVEKNFFIQQKYCLSLKLDVYGNWVQ